MSALLALGTTAIAQSDACRWSALESDGQVGVSGLVEAMTVYDDGNGPALFVGGGLGSGGRTIINNIGRWDGSAWQPLPGPMGVGVNSRVLSMAVFDDGSGPALYVGGVFSEAGVGFGQPGGLLVERVARWDGSEWSALEGPFHAGVRLCTGPRCLVEVLAMAVYDDGSGPALYIAGNFTRAGGIIANHIARWDGQDWSPLISPGGGETENGVNARVTALVVHDDGTGEALYVGGEFTTAGGQTANRIARWTADGWAPVDPFGVGLDAAPEALAVFDYGDGPQLFAGGSIFEAQFEPVNNIARWDGREWWSLEDPIGRELNGRVRDLIVFDDGAGPALYASGDMVRTGDRTLNHLGKWLGLGNGWTGLEGPAGIGLSDNVPAMGAYDDGTGAGLYAGGLFSDAGGIRVSSIGRWSCQRPCRADLDGDGELTLFDFLAFQNAFAMGDPVADFDGDGDLTLFDFLAFQNDFALGCP
jgi:hypothetical protein